VGLPCKILFVGGSPKPGVHRTLPRGGICFVNFTRASKQKLLLGVGLPCKILFVGGSPQPRACRVHPTKWGYLHSKLCRGQQTKIASRGGFDWKDSILGLSPNQGPQGPPHQMGVHTLRIGRGPANKSCSSGWVYLVEFYFGGHTSLLGPQGPPTPNGVIGFEQFS
jgi:hypothetical protein